MNAAVRQSWFPRALLVGALYAAIGVVFALPFNNVRVWRLAAWVTSAAVYAAHIAYERVKIRYSSWSTALHVAIAASIGGLGLAVAATARSIIVPPSYQRTRFLLALVVWPIVTGLPAFLVALVASAALGLLLRNRSA
jgi:hypothetical protein